MPGMRFTTDEAVFQHKHTWLHYFEVGQNLHHYYFCNPSLTPGNDTEG